MFNNQERRRCIEQIIDNLKAKGTFDQLRRECMAEVDIKPSYGNLLQRVEGYVSNYLYRQKWTPKLNKNQLRNRLRNEINESDMLKKGVLHLVDQVVNEKTRKQFDLKIKEALSEYLGITNDEEQNQKDPEQDKCNEMEQKISEENALNTQRLKEESDNNNLEIVSDQNDENSNSFTQNNIVSEINPTDNYDPNTVDMDIDSSDEAGEIDVVSMCHPPEESPAQIQVKEEELESSQSQNEIDDLQNASESINVTKNMVKEEEKINDFETKQSFNDESLNNLDDKSIKTTDSSNKVKLPEEKVHSDEVSGVQETLAENRDDLNDIVSEISDVSSVHTSDLSDFDDRISIEGSDSDEAKTKISLKIVKQLAASITEIKDDTTKKQLPIAEPIDPEKSKINDKVENTEKVNDNNKRKRKRNPKFLSSEYSYNVRSRKTATETEPVEKSVAEYRNEEIKLEVTKSSKRKLRTSESEITLTIKEPKLNRQNSKQNVVAKKASETAVNSNSNINSNNSANSNHRPKKNLKSQNSRQDQSNKRYDSSDLYKPRHHLTSSRRSRSFADPSTPDSNSNSNDELDR